MNDRKIDTLWIRWKSAIEQLVFETAATDVKDLLQNQCRFLYSANEQSINARGALKRGEHEISEKKKASTDRCSELSESVGRQLASVRPDVKKISEEQFRVLLYSVDPSQFGDTWEGCFGDAAS